MEKGEKIEKAFTHLYNYFYNENSKCSSHLSKAIYFCSEENCNTSYICSECLIEQPDHFAKHYKFLIPIDDKKKFFKFLNCPLEDIMKQLTPKQEEINVEDFYEFLKEKICVIIEQHKKNNVLKIKEELNNKEKESIPVQNEIYQKLNNLIDEFMMNNNKHEIQSLIQNVNKHVKVIINSLKNGDMEIDDNKLSLSINNIIEDNIKKSFGLNNIWNNCLNSYNSKDKKEIKEKFTLNLDFVDDKKENIKENEIIKEESSTTGRLDTIHEEIENGNTNEEEQEHIEHNKNIKSRLEMLKHKINNIKK